MASEPVGEDRRVKFLLTRAPDFRVVAANGAWGGATPRGDFRMDFYVESVFTPDSVTHLVRADGTLGDELSRTPANGVQISRDFQVGVLLSIDHAETIANWMNEKIAEFRKLQAPGHDEEQQS